MIAVNIAVVGLIFVPYLILIMTGRKEHNKINKIFEQEAKKLGLKISEKDQWNLNAIGVDLQQQKLLFVQRKEQDFKIELIDLSLVKTVELLHEEKASLTSGKPEVILLNINLKFQQFSGEEISLSLYDSNFCMDQDHEMKHAEKWCNLVNNIVSTRPKIKKAA